MMTERAERTRKPMSKASEGGGCMGYMGNLTYDEILKRFIGCYGADYREDELRRIHNRWKSLTKKIIKGRD